jgi:hypothetical protein
MATLCLAGFAPLGFVLEPLVGEEELLTRGEDELRSAVDALEDLIPVFHPWLPCSYWSPPPRLQAGWKEALRFAFHPRLTAAGLVLTLSCLLPAAFASQSFLDSPFLSGFQIEGVFLNLLDNVFLLHLALETSKRVL